jgi:cytochrome d ubiquinol oxidase subunit I
MEIFSDTVLLARIQFAFTVMFHYLYPPLSIGLGVLLVVMEGLFLKTKNPIYEVMTRFWVKIFALNFSLGVATGIVMEFQFGTNWATYSRFVGDVFGSALAAEGVFAFFLESGFLAILVFGWDRVSAKMHFFSTCMVSLGSMFSAVWIVVANSWQQTPAGYHIVDKMGHAIPTPYEYDPFAAGVQPRAEIIDFWAMVFNPSSMARLSHVMVGAFILAAFFVMSICAYYIIKGRHIEFAKRAFKIALIFGMLSSVGQLLLGHWSADIVAKHQPAKLAAFEGIFKTEESTPAYLFGFPDKKTESVRGGIAIPGMLSFLVHRDFKTPVTGLDKFEPRDRPPLMVPFQMYHVMIALGMYFIGVTLLACFLMWRGTLFEKKWLMKLFTISVVFPYIANQAGWIAAEVGRQPWIVYGLLRTSDGVSKAVGAHAIVSSLVIFTLIYVLLFVMFIYLLDKKIKHGPEEHHAPSPSQDAISVADVAGLRGPGQGRLADAGEET